MFREGGGGQESSGKLSPWPVRHNIGILAITMELFFSTLDLLVHDHFPPIDHSRFRSRHDYETWRMYISIFIFTTLAVFVTGTFIFQEWTIVFNEWYTESFVIQTYEAETFDVKTSLTTL